MYDFRQSLITVSAAAGVTGVKLFGANSQRLSLIVTSNAQNIAGGTAHVSLATLQQTSRIWYDQTPPINMILPYRNYGPIIREEVWVFTNSAVSVDVYGTEVFKLP